MNAPNFLESHISQISAIQFLQQLGFTYLNPEEVAVERRGKLGDVSLEDVLTNHLRRASPWTDSVGAAGNGSVRVRIWFDALGRFEFPLPSLDEQRAIAAVFDTADAELRLLRPQCTALDNQNAV